MLQAGGNSGEFKVDDNFRAGQYLRPKNPLFYRDFWWALVDDLRTLPPGQIVAGIPNIGDLSLL